MNRTNQCKMRKIKSDNIVCDVCKKTIPLYPASVGMNSKKMGIDFQVLPRLEKNGEEAALCPDCLQKAADTAKIVIYASAAAWRKFRKA